MADMVSGDDGQSFESLMREKRKGTSAQFPLLDPEFQPNPDAVDPLEGAGFGELTPEQEARLEEEKAAKSAQYGERLIDRSIDTAQNLSLVDPTPISDTVATGLELTRGVMDEVGAEELSRIGSLGLAAAMVPFIGTKQLRLFKKHAKTGAAADARDLLRDYSRRIDAGEITKAQAHKELQPKLNQLAQDAAYEGSTGLTKDAAKKISKSKLTDKQLRERGAQQRVESDVQVFTDRAKGARTTSNIDRDLYGKASVGEFAGGQGTFVSGGRARDLGEEKRLRGSMQDPANPYGSERVSTGPGRTIQRSGQTMYARPGAQMELEALRKQHRAKPSKDRGPEPTEADVPGYYVTPEKYRELTTAGTGSTEMSDRLRAKRAATRQRIDSSVAKQEAAKQAAKPTGFNEIETDFLLSVPKDQYDQARKILEDTNRRGGRVVRDGKGGFRFESGPPTVAKPTPTAPPKPAPKPTTTRTRKSAKRVEPPKDLPRAPKLSDDELAGQTFDRLDALIEKLGKFELGGGDSKGVVGQLRSLRGAMESGRIPPSEVAKRLDKIENPPRPRPSPDRSPRKSEAELRREERMREREYNLRRDTEFYRGRDPSIEDI
jgi:hypothetical protein